MTRVPRIHIEGAIFYVTSRGDNDRNIFTETADYTMYLELLKKYQEQYGFKLYAYCLLPSHLHLLIELKAGLTISDIMHDLNSNYTKYFNGKYERKGHLFQERYKMILAEKEKYLAGIAEYIFQNPVKLGLVKAAEEYQYQRTEVRGQISEDLVKALAHQAILGADEFIKKIDEVQRSADSVQRLENPWHKRLLLAGTTAIIILGFFTIYIYATSANKETRLKTTLKEEEVKNIRVLKDLDKKYQQEMDAYYKDLAKRLQIEKQKAKSLEDKLSGEAK